ncbi:MAG TPA: tRNA (adenosine(37)-N6)-dimethylallyltransferase MiaA [Actinomycetota bacterium]|nr:tRNA (adenosine(37)-N6)-dimethylallyltransferase MiaA [Actinomycetota bacterium]
MIPGETLLALVGPTASGKTEAGVAVAEALGAEVISVDSTTIYRGMDVGSAKPTPEHRSRVAHHLVDVADPDESFTVARYQALAREAIDDIIARGRRVLLVGGSGLYFRAIVDDLAFPPTDASTRAALEDEAAAVGGGVLYRRLQELDPVAAGRIEPDNVRRTIRALEVAGVTGRRFSEFAADWTRYRDERVRAAGIDLRRDVLARRIDERVRAQLDAGFLDEVRMLLDRGIERSPTARQAIGYAEVSRFLAGECSLDEAAALIVRRTKALARRQTAWFRRDPRIRWFTAGEAGAADVLDDVVGYLRG